MKKTFKKEACGLVLLGLLPLAALPLADWLRIERIARKDVKASCAPLYERDCWPILAKSVRGNPYTYRFEVSGGETSGPAQSSHSLIYDRRSHTLVESKFFTFGDGAADDSTQTFHGMTDETIKQLGEVFK
jgi:hypothetical protein